MKTELILTVVAGIVSSARGDAQSPDTTTLQPVVVSASKIPRRTDVLSQAVTVLSGDDLRARGVVRVSDALREVPGAQLVQSGSFGSVTSLFLRGGESRHTKVLIDGVAVNSAGGFFDFSHLTTNDIDRIEIVRGPASVLYGADAVSGVVQIFTRRGAARPTASMSVRGGTYGTVDADLENLGATNLAHSALRSRGYRRNVEGRFAFFLPTNTALTVGGVYEREHENSTTGSGAVGAATTQTDAFDATRHSAGYYAELLGNPIERVSYTLSGRIDDNSDYARFTTYRIGGNVGVLQGLRLRASLSNAFNAPAFNELRPTLYTVGSPNLKPERIRSAEVGLVASLAGDAVRVSTSYFKQRFADLIQYVNGGPPDYKGSFANLNVAVSNGYEAEVQATVAARWRANASYTIVNPRVDAVDSNYQGDVRAGDALLRRPSHSGSVGVSYVEAGGFNLGTAVTYVGQRPDLDFSQFPSPRVSQLAYTKVAFSGGIPLLNRVPHLTLTARVENLFGKRYEEVLHFGAAGRTILVGGRASLTF